MATLSKAGLKGRMALIATVLVITAAAIFFVHVRGAVFAVQPSYILNGRLVVPKAVTHWKALIGAIGSAESHDRMVEEGDGIDPSLRHVLAHTFGEALYETGGMDSVVYCGNGEFVLGCYHQVIGQAIAEHGNAAIKEMKDICEKAPGAVPILCPHAIGHGLVAQEGYDENGILAALSSCSSLFDTAHSQSCSDGVFMEYNLHDMIDPGHESTARAFLSSKAYDPCLSVPVRFRNECALQLSNWWYATQSAQASSTESLYARMGLLCRNMPVTMRAPCFMGIGYAAAQGSSFSPAAIQLDCTAAASGGPEHLWCITFAARRFTENGLPSAMHTCHDLGLTGAALTYCTTFEQRARSEAFLLPTPQ